jgi:hypothetical protein
MLWIEVSENSHATAPPALSSSALSGRMRTATERVMAASLPGSNSILIDTAGRRKEAAGGKTDEDMANAPW